MPERRKNRYYITYIDLPEKFKRLQRYGLGVRADPAISYPTIGKIHLMNVAYPQQPVAQVAVTRSRGQILLKRNFMNKYIVIPAFWFDLA
jgi:hypothetical protein